MSAISAISKEAFFEHAHRIAQDFERRRTLYLNKLKFRAVVACVLLFTFPFWYSILTRWDYLGDGISQVGLLVIHVLAAVIIVVLIAAFALRPLFRYRYETIELAAVLPGARGAFQPVSLKSEIFTKLLRYFGEFTMYDDRKMSLGRFRDAPNIPEFDECECTDYIKGQIDGITVEISEVTLSVQQESSSVPIFNGIFVIMDINNPNVKLRGKFSGKTALIVDNNAAKSFITSKYDGYKRVQLVDSSFTQKIEAYSTNNEEASRLLTAEFLRGVLKLSDTVKSASQQRRSVDDKIAYALERIASGLADIMAGGGAVFVNWFKTGSLRTSSTRHRVQSKPSDVSDTAAFNSCVQCAFYEDKVLISLPTQQNWFEPDSVFYPPLTEEDITLTYRLMSGISELGSSVISSLPKDMV